MARLGRMKVEGHFIHVLIPLADIPLIRLAISLSTIIGSPSDSALRPCKLDDRLSARIEFAAEDSHQILCAACNCTRVDYTVCLCEISVQRQLFESVHHRSLDSSPTQLDYSSIASLRLLRLEPCDVNRAIAVEVNSRVRSPD